MDESKSMRLLGLRVMKNARSRRCIEKVEWSSVNFEDVSYLQRVARVGWRADGLRVEDLPRSHSIGHSPQNSSRPTRKAHAWKPQWSKNLHVNVDEDSCALTSRKIKEYASNFNDGHCILGTPRRKQVVLRICNQLWWQVESSCFTNGGRFREFWTSGIPGDKSAGPWNTCVGLLIPRTSSVSTEQSQSGGPYSGEAGQSRPEGARKTSTEIQIKQEDLKSLVGTPRLPHASENRTLQNLKDSIRCHLWAKLNISEQRRNSTIRSRKEIIMSQQLLKMTDGKIHRCAKNTQRPEISRIQGHAHQLMQNKKLVLS